MIKAHVISDLELHEAEWANPIDETLPDCDLVFINGNNGILRRSMVFAETICKKYPHVQVDHSGQYVFPGDIEEFSSTFFPGMLPSINKVIIEHLLFNKVINVFGSSAKRFLLLKNYDISDISITVIQNKINSYFNKNCAYNLGAVLCSDFRVYNEFYQREIFIKKPKFIILEIIERNFYKWSNIYKDLSVNKILSNSQFPADMNAALGNGVVSLIVQIPEKL